MEINLELPKKWIDLKQGQLEAVAGFFLRYKDKTEFLTHCFFLFSGWKLLGSKYQAANEGEYYFRKNKGKPFSIHVEIFRIIVNELSWIFNRFWICSYVPPIRNFTTPNLYLYDVSFERYLAADNHFQIFSASGDPEFLDKMIAVLYRKDFRQMDMEKEIKRLKGIPLRNKYAVFIWYSGVKTWIREKYPWLYNNQSGTGEENPDEVFLKILSALNNGDITLNKRILETPVHQALYELNQKIENQKL